MARVLVTDAGYKNALAAIRCLGRHGLEVDAASRRGLAPGFFSRYTTSRLVYPSPSDEERFVESIVSAARERGVDVVLPIGGETTRILSRHKEAVEAQAALPVADWEAMRIASDKSQTMAFAERNGIPVPKTFASVDEVDAFPVVVKSSLGSGGVHYVNGPDELRRLDVTDAVVQEYVPGEGYGFFALFVDGVERAVFMHRRIREFPVTGGASTAAESFFDPVLQELGLSLLRALRWHGVAMVEFKRDRRDGSYRLMEINPKFWGSLDLSIAAGVEFPWLAVQAALGEPVDESFPYPVGLRFRWTFEDLMHTIARPRSLGAFLRDFSPGVRSDLVWSDPVPLLVGGAITSGNVVRRLARGRLRAPHGRPTAPGQ